MEMQFDLPFIEFLPSVMPITLKIEAEALEARMFLPESHTLRNPLLALHRSANLHTQGNTDDDVVLPQVQWKRITNTDNGSWVDCMAAPMGGSLTLYYGFHPNPVEYEPLNPESYPPRPQMKGFDPDTLEPDLIRVDLEIGPSVLKLSGMLIRLFFYMKENYFGESQDFIDFDQFASQSENLQPPFGHMNEENFSPEKLRSLQVILNVHLNEIQAHCLTFASAGDPHCPVAFVEELVFQMDKRYYETKLQLTLSPIHLHLVDHFERIGADNESLQEGQLMLNAFQLRGHAMFSNVDTPVDAPTVEYAWLMEFIVGELTGRLTASQVLRFLFLFANKIMYENIIYAQGNTIGNIA